MIAPTFGINDSRYWPRLSGAFTALLLCSLGCTPSFAAFGFPNPFHPEQCAIALARADRLRRTHPSDARAALIRAEGLLCAGVQDDPEALDRAIVDLEDAARREPGNFFAHLYLAEAVRKRYSFSDEALQAFVNAGAALTRAAVGAARPELQAYIDQSIEGVRQGRQQFSRRSREHEAALAAGQASSFQIGSWLTLLAQTGPAGLRRAVATLEAHVAAHSDETLNTLYRAELARGRLPSGTLHALYRAAEATLCTTGSDVPRQQACALARRRLRQLGAEAAVLTTPRSQPTSTW